MCSFAARALDTGLNAGAFRALGDAEAGRPIRGEIADELVRTALPVPEPIAWWDCAAPDGLRWAAKGTPPAANDFEDGSLVVVLPILKSPEEH